MNFNNQLLEEIKRFKLLSNYDPSLTYKEQKIIKEEVTFFGEDKYFMLVFKGRNEKPKLVEIGTAFEKNNQFIPTKKGKELFQIDKDSYDWNLLKKNQIFVLHRSYGMSQEGKILADFELDELVNGLVEDNNEYVTELENRIEETNSSNWNKTSSGSILIDMGLSLKYANAIYVRVDSHVDKFFNLLEGPVKPSTQLLSYTPTPPLPTTGVTIPEIIVNETVNTYCDNMIKPNLSKKEVLAEFNSVLNAIKNYVDSPNDDENISALSKLKNSTLRIFGQADSARPGWLPGEPCRSVSNVLDHNYGGMEKKPVKMRTQQDIIQMNSFLAQNRAIEYGKLLSAEIKKLYGFDLKIEYSYKQYYGQGESKRGPKFRSITLNFDVPRHTYSVTSGSTVNVAQSINNEITNSGFVWKMASIYTTKGVKKFSCISRGDNLWCSEKNKLGIIKEEERGEINMLPKISYSVNAEIKGMDLVIKSSVGDLTLKGQNGGYGSVYMGGSQQALFRTWMVCGQKDYSTISFPEPFKDAYYTYDPNNKVKILEDTYYLVKGFGYVMFAMACAANIKPTTPSETEIASEMVKDKPIYNQKQLKFLSKQVDKSIGRTIKDIEIKNTKEKKGEAIQDDPYMMK